MINLRNSITYFSIASISLLNSCAILYSPSLPNIPLFSEEEQTQISISRSINGIELQAAQKILDDFALIAEYQTSATDEMNDLIVNSKFFEAGAGWLYANSGHFRFEIFVGGGIGKLKSENSGIAVFNDNLPARAEGNAQKYFIQTEIGSSFKFLEGAFFGRLVNVNFSGMKFENYLTPPTTNASFTEFGLLLRLGPPKMKLQLIGGFTNYIGKKDAFLEYNPFILGFGVNLKL